MGLKDLFANGRQVYEQNPQASFGFYRIDQNVTKPLPLDVAAETDDLLSSDAELLRLAEASASEIIAPRLGFIFQAISKNDVVNAVLAIDQQPEILESPLVVESLVTGLVEIIQQDPNLVTSLPRLHSSLGLIEQWNFSDIKTKNLLEPLVNFVYLEKGISLKRESHDPRQLISQLSDLSAPFEEDGHLSNSELFQHLSQVVNDMEGPEFTDLSHDELLPQKLLESVTGNPKIFNQLHPRVQQEIQGTLKGFQLAVGQK